MFSLHMHADDIINMSHIILGKRKIVADARLQRVPQVLTNIRLRNTNGLSGPGCCAHDQNQSIRIGASLDRLVVYGAHSR